MLGSNTNVLTKPSEALRPIAIVLIKPLRGLSSNNIVLTKQPCALGSSNSEATKPRSAVRVRLKVAPSLRSTKSSSKAKLHLY